MIGLYVNNSTPERFAFRIICGLKTIETRTKRAAKSFLSSGVKPGQRIAISANGTIYGYVTFQGVKEYDSRAAFMADYAAHGVKPGSKFDYNPNTGKVGLVFSDASARKPGDMAYKVQRTGGYTWTTVDR